MRDQRDNGRQLVLDTIRSTGAIARIDIAKATGFSPATVTAITSQLLLAGLISEQPDTTVPNQTKRGRPRVLLKLNGAAHLVAGLKVAQSKISVLILDFEGTEIVAYETPLPAPRMSPDELTEQVLRSLNEACAAGGFSIDDLSGVGVGLAGQLDARRGFVHWSSSLTERNVDLTKTLIAKAPCPVFIGNDANLVAMAELMFGEGQNVPDFLVVTLEYGVGMGIIIDGMPYLGTRGCGAELGHTKVQMDGALCQCGQRGCLEAYVGDYAILREAQIGGKIYADVSEVFDAADKGDPSAVLVVERAGRMFAMGVANLVNIFDPKRIILTGAQAPFGHISAEKLGNDVAGMAVQVDASPPEIIVHQWGDHMWAKGAAAYAIQQVSALTVKSLSTP